jgi:hypothetical protein
MGYQKLQGHNALRVVTSDTINIPNPSTLAVSGTNTSTSANNLVDNTVGINFLTLQIRIGSIVYNTTDGSCAVVTSVAANTLGLSANIFTATSKAYSIYAENNTPAVLYIGGAGNVRVLTEGGNDVTFNGTLAGSYFPIQVLKVFASGTTATNIIAIW